MHCPAGEHVVSFAGLQRACGVPPRQSSTPELCPYRGLTPSEPDLWALCHPRAACCLYFFSLLLGPSFRQAGLPFFVQCLARNSAQKIFAECWEKRRNKSLGKMGGGSLRPREYHRFTQNRVVLSFQTSFCCLVASDIIC